VDTAVSPTGAANAPRQTIAQPDEAAPSQDATATLRVSAETSPPVASSGDVEHTVPADQAEQDQQAVETRESAEQESVEGVRTWTDAKGVTVAAAFIDIKDGTVRFWR